MVNRIEFPMAHDIEVLVGLLPDDISLLISLEAQRKLTNYATVTRYPGAYEPITLEEAQFAVETANRGVIEIRRHLPSQEEQAQ